MKKLIVTSLATLACLGAFAQGKISFATDSLHLVYYDSSDTGTNASSAYLAGTPVNNANMPAGVTLVADLYGGTSASTLSLISTTAFGATAGRWTSAFTTFASIPASSPAFFQIQIRDNAFATAAAALAGNSYGGSTAIFTAVPQPSSFNPIYQHTSPVLSTWTDGTFNMDGVSVGSKGAIAVMGPAAVVPEPATFALAGLGAAALLIFRRRK